MAKKSNFSTALWFIPLVACVLAVLFTILGLIVWKVFKLSAPKPQQSAATAAPAKPGTAAKQPTQSVPAAVAVPVQDTRPPATTVLSFSPARARFEMAYAECLNRHTYPCAWEDNQDGVLKKFSISKEGGMVFRNTYSPGGILISQTGVSPQGNVVIYREKGYTYFFDNSGLVRRIMKEVSPLSGPDDPHHNYYYDVNGQLNACVCADKNTDCCPDAPVLSGPRTYCGRQPLDAEFCKQ